MDYRKLLKEYNSLLAENNRLKEENLKLRMLLGVTEKLHSEQDSGTEISEGKTRSELIERALRLYIAQKKRDKLNARDVEIIHKRSDYLNEEADDVLSYQIFK
ncbi:hypothetical protein ACFL27_07900 [candidate division CSSED10-310 bacterium]|uniref:Ribbon-helix-helix protein, CopG family n=1 Tax=candidate division CSSED10-310 bacterium TaxID=2855610 RepID=A0ABV6YV79_UNCC1